MKTRYLGQLPVSAIGYGCMGLSHGYGPVPLAKDSIHLIHQAYDLGCTFFDTAEGYGDGANEELVGKAIAEAITPLIKKGKIRAWGLSQCTADTLRRAYRITPVTAVQSEYSIMERMFEADVIPTCQHMGIGFVPFSPLGAGFLSGKYHAGDHYEGDDVRRVITRFTDDNVRKNNTNYDASVDASTSASIVDHDGQRMGTTELMARDIQQQVQGDLFLIHAATPYPTNFDDVVDQNHTEAAQRTIEAAGVPVRIDKLLPAKRPNPVTSAKIRTPWRKIRKNYTLFPQQHTLTCMISQNTSIKLSKN